MPAWQAESNQETAEFGKSVGSAGDVNGDGFDDILVGCHYFSNPEYREGKVFLYYGSSSGPDTSASWAYESNSANATLGISVSGAGDVNGDGFDDVIIGAHTFTGDMNSEGKVFVFYGSAEGLNDSPDWEAEGNQIASDFGGTVSEAGDVNGDGYDDVIIGAVFYDGDEVDQGRVYVYYGSAYGLGDTPWIAEVVGEGITFGSHVSGAGDVNGDGYDDVIAGCRKYSDGESSEGAAFVYLGSATGLSDSYDWHYESNLTGTKLGQSVSTAGDVNSDGYADVIISGHNYSQPEVDEGYALIFLGSSLGLASTPHFQHEANQTNALFGNQCADAGDVNADGFDDVIIGSREYTNGETSEGRVYVYFGSATGMSESSFWTAESNQANAFLGYAVASAGDVNGDGADDVLCGAKYWDGGQEDEGGAFLYTGIPSSAPCNPINSAIIGTVTSNSVTLSWDETPSATEYRITLLTNGDKRVFTVSGNSILISGLAPSAKYKVMISCRCGSQFSQRFFAGTFTTMP